MPTELFGVATLDLTGAFGTPVIQLSLVPVEFGPAIPVLTWLIGLAAVWRLGTGQGHHRVLEAAALRVSSG